MNWFNTNAGLVQWLTLLVTLIVGFVAFRIGSTQNEINRSIQKLQDSVEIFAYPVVNPQTGKLFLRLTNVGTVQLYMTTYMINGGPDRMLGHSLIPASQQQNAWFDIPISPSADISDKRIVIELEDGLNRKWESVASMVYDGGWIVSVTRITQK